MLTSWIKRDQLDVTCFIISLYNKASDIKLVPLYWTIKMMHGPINIRYMLTLFVLPFSRNVIHSHTHTHTHTLTHTHTHTHTKRLQQYMEWRKEYFNWHSYLWTNLIAHSWILASRVAHICRIYRSHLIFVDARRMTWCKFHTVETQIISATVKI